MNDLIRQLNVRHVTFVSCAALLFQILNFFKGPFWQDRYLALGFVLVSIVCAFYFVYTAFFHSRILVRPGRARAAYLSFWVLLFFAMTPYFISDLLTIKRTAAVAPINVTLFCATMIIVPIFTKTEVFAFSFFYLAANLAIAAAFRAPQTYYVFIVGISVARFLFSYFVQHFYVTMLWELKVETRFDALTGLLSRKAGLEQMAVTMELCKRHGENMAVYMADIDFFKNYNDHYGHLQGDEALRKVGEALASVFSRGSDAVCRFGGEEFVICSSLSAEAEVRDMGLKMLLAVSDLKIGVPENGVSDVLTVSIGYSLYRPHKNNINEDILTVIGRADAAMYEAKRSGRNRLMPEAPPKTGKPAE